VRRTVGLIRLTGVKRPFEGMSWQKSTDSNILSSMWTEGQQTSKIVHIEPLTP
jgi:hypothetical protein